MLKLCSHGGPFVPAPCDIYGIVNEAEFFVGSFKFKFVPIRGGVINAESDDISRCIRDFDAIRFDMSNCESSLLDLIHEIDHEQGTTLGDNIVYVSWVFEYVWESCGRKSINGV